MKREAEPAPKAHKPSKADGKAAKKPAAKEKGKKPRAFKAY